MRIFMAAAAATILATCPAQANITFNLSNVTFTSTAGGSDVVGTLTGSFTTNDARSALIDYNLSSSAGGGLPAFVYTPTTAPVSTQTLPSQFFQLNGGGTGLPELRVFFASGLTATGGTILSTNSYESRGPLGFRYLNGSVVAASVAAVPEPATWGLMILGFGLVGTGMRGRRRSVTASYI